jgi:hypothetical protein
LVVVQEVPLLVPAPLQVLVENTQLQVLVLVLELVQ